MLPGPQPSAAPTRSCPSSTRGAGWSTAILACLVWATPLSAQVTTTSAPASAGRLLPPDLLRISGVRQGMANEALFTLANAHLDANLLNEAEQIMRFVANEEKDNTENQRWQINLHVHNRLGYLYELLTKRARDTGATAEGDAWQAQAIGRYTFAAELARRRGRYDAAEKMLQRVLWYQPLNVLAQLEFARVLALTNRPREAIERYKAYATTDRA